MPRIEIECLKCHAKCVTASAAEAAEWDEAHASRCLGPKAGEAVERCSFCDGCGQVADTPAQEPWSAWASLPYRSAAAVLLGDVRPIPCPQCQP